MYFKLVDCNTLYWLFFVLSLIFIGQQCLCSGSDSEAAVANIGRRYKRWSQLLISKHDNSGEFTEQKGGVR
ncbi:hypothetical protein EDC56_3722 [Sinobacterium caligoides]|uniref:Uncharacterized protein n=1 Tax=Sinobacterium caligoides TaxID=933926 RepID=A0A3N2D5K6_9GAMM|nr:hypothetical protein EDC56_3722 [Sinobacterium caligoides]